LVASTEKQLSERLEEIKLVVSASVSYSFRKMFEGEAARANFVSHLIEWYHYVKTVCPQMALTRDALGKDFAPVAEYLRLHIEEERGHDQILLGDLERLGFTASEIEAHPPSREIINLIGSQNYVIGSLHPVGFLGHIYALESQPPTDELIKSLGKTLDIREDCLSFYAAHCETDIGHLADLKHLLDTADISPQLQTIIEFNVRITLENLSDFFLAIAVGDHWSRTAEHH